MPIFEYVCPNCGHSFENLTLTRNHDAPECPKCGWKRVEQQLSAFSTSGAAGRSGRALCAPSSVG